MRPPPGWSKIRSLTFEQIAEFCGLHILEVQAIADDTAATKLTGRDPIRAGELTHEEIEKGQKDPDYRLQMHKAPEAGPPHQGPALHAGLQAPGQAGRHRLDHQEPSGGHRRPDQQADRHHAHDHRRDPRPQPLEHGQHHAEGSGDARPDARSASSTPRSPRRPRRRASQAPTDTRFEGDREALIEELRARARAACARGRGGARRSRRRSASRRDRPGHPRPVQEHAGRIAARLI